MIPLNKIKESSSCIDFFLVLQVCFFVPKTILIKMHILQTTTFAFAFVNHARSWFIPSVSFSWRNLSTSPISTLVSSIFCVFQGRHFNIWCAYDDFLFSSSHGKSFFLWFICFLRGIIISLTFFFFMSSPCLTFLTVGICVILDIVLHIFFSFKYPCLDGDYMGNSHV